MLLAIDNVLTVEEVRTVRTQIETLDFADGTKTAGPGHGAGKTISSWPTTSIRRPSAGLSAMHSCVISCSSFWLSRNGS